MPTTYLVRMDVEWFKSLQKANNLTSYDLGKAIGRERTAVSRILNGTQKMTLEQAGAIAIALKVPVREVVERAGILSPAKARAILPGFGEGDAVPFATQGADGLNAEQIGVIASALGRNRPGIDVWRVKGVSMMLAGLLPGDFMLVDQHLGQRPQSGDIVIAQVDARHEPTTVLRRYSPPVLVAASVDPNETVVHVVDGVNVSIFGVVVASWRDGPIGTNRYTYPDMFRSSER